MWGVSWGGGSGAGGRGTVGVGGRAAPVGAYPAAADATVRHFSSSSSRVLGDGWGRVDSLHAFPLHFSNSHSHVWCVSKMESFLIAQGVRLRSRVRAHNVGF